MKVEIEKPQVARSPNKSKVNIKAVTLRGTDFTHPSQEEAGMTLC